MENYENLYKNALERARVWKEKSGMPADKQGILDDIFPELAGSEDEQIRKELTKHLKEGVEGYMPAGDSSDYRRWLDWLEKQGKQKPIIEMKSAEESLGVDSNTYNEIVDECIYGEQKPIEWDADDDEKFFFLKARLKDYEDCIIYDEELSKFQKNNVRETTKEFLEWLDSIKERMGG